MSAEKLKALVEKGNLINLNIVSDSLANLLNEVANMLVEQQKQIVELKKEVGEKCVQSDFDSFRDQWRSDRETIMRSFPNIEDKFTRIENDIKSQNDETKDYVENSVSNLLISVDNRILQKTDLIAANVQFLTHSLSELEEKVNSNQRSALISARSISNPLQSDDSDIHDRVQKLEEQIGNLLNSSEHASGRADKSAISSQESEEVKTQIDESTLEALRAEIKEQLQQMQQEIEIANPPEKQENLEQENQDFIEQGEISESAPDEYNEFEQMKIEIGQIEEAIEEQNKSLISRIERKMESSLVERMFEKLRLIIESTKNDISELSTKIEVFVEKKQMEDYVKGTIRNLLEDEQASFTSKPLRCLACGRIKLNAQNLEIMQDPQASTSKEKNSELPALKFTIPRI